jgi:hypothetical protein
MIQIQIKQKDYFEMKFVLLDQMNKLKEFALFLTKHEIEIQKKSIMRLF